MLRVAIVGTTVLMLAGGAPGAEFVAKSNITYEGSDTDAIQGQLMIASEGRLRKHGKTLTDGSGADSVFFTDTDRPNSGYWMLGPECPTRCVTGVDVWLSGEDRSRYVYHVQIAVSTDGVTYKTVGDSGKVTPACPADHNLARFRFKPEETRAVRYIRLVSVPTGNPHVRIREVDVFTEEKPSLAANPGKGAPLPIGNRRQLFLDDWVIERLDGLQRRLGEPVKHPASPVLRREKPWDAWRCELSGSAVWDPDRKKIRLFYTATGKIFPSGSYSGGRDRDSCLALAESDDGVTWTRPEFDLFPYGDSRKTNIVLGMWKGLDWIHGAGVCLDPADPDPSRRYKLFTDIHYATHVFFSPDGIHWTPSRKNPVTQHHSDTGNCPFWDPIRKQYVAYVRMRTHQGIRCVGRVDSADFEDWSPWQQVFAPGADDRARAHQFYQHSVTPYQGLYVGLTHVFRAAGAAMDRKAHSPIIWPELTVSRDGAEWRRVGALGTPFLPLGPAGSFDHRMIRTSSSLVVMDDRILLFYSGSPNIHHRSCKWDIGLATLRVDGFVSLVAGKKQGTLETKPLRLTGRRLRINASVDPGGSIRAELLGARRGAVSGYGADRCRPFRGDSLAGELAWEGKASLPSCPPGGLRVRFFLTKAKLYSFWVE